MKQKVTLAKITADKPNEHHLKKKISTGGAFFSVSFE